MVELTKNTIPKAPGAAAETNLDKPCFRAKFCEGRLWKTAADNPAARTENPPPVFSESAGEGQRLRS